MENTRNKPARRRLPLAVYLAFLLVAALAFTGASFASYKTQATSSDSARVARFVVTAAKDTSQTTEDLTLDSSNTSVEYKFTVSNTDASDVNETATRYSVAVTLPEALPTGVTMKLTRGTDTTAIANTQSGNTYTFSDDGMLFSAAAERTDTYTLTFTADSSAGSGTLEGINITVNAEQVD